MHKSCYDRWVQEYNLNGCAVVLLCFSCFWKTKGQGAGRAASQSSVLSTVPTKLLGHASPIYLHSLLCSNSTQVSSINHLVISLANVRVSNLSEGQ